MPDDFDAWLARPITPGGTTPQQLIDNPGLTTSASRLRLVEMAYREGRRTQYHQTVETARRNHLDLLNLLLRSAPRRVRIGQDSGDTFVDDDDFDGWTLTLELRDEFEAAMIAAAITAAHPHWRVTDETGGPDA